MPRLAPPLLLSVALLSGCVRKTLDTLTTQRVVPRALAVPDVDRTCKVGEALGHPLGSFSRKPPHRALVIADATAAICDHQRALDAQLRGATARQAFPAGPGRIATVKDAGEEEARYRSRSALRFHSAWTHANAAFGELGAEVSCPRVRERDELTLLVGLVSGALGMVNDKASSSRNGVPLDTLSRVSRTAPCLDDAKWFHAPSALEAAAWIVVPGSGPDGIDPWEQLETAARAGESSGVRFGWALMAILAANADEDARLETALVQGAKSFDATPPNPDFAMLDAFSRALLLHESDLVWAAARGHRTLELGTLPEPEAPPPVPGADPFGEDPFGEDPFDEDPFGSAEPESPDEAPVPGGLETPFE